MVTKVEAMLHQGIDRRLMTTLKILTDSGSP